VDGQRAYDAARRGRPLELKPARVTVHAWESLAWREVEFDARITCSGGTYVRSLARDLGRATGSAAHLAALRRMAVGAYRVSDAVTLDALTSGAGALRPMREAVAGLPAVALDAASVARASRGMPVDAEVSVATERVALIDATGDLVALADRQGAGWHPFLVLRDA
jgi:tRNA pseudouridine55 synthase